MIKEFKEFINRGNVVDLAVGVIIGGAFGKIVTSLVNDVLMPLLGILIGGINLSNLTLTFNDATIAYGVFLQNIIDFLIVAISIFFFIKVLNKLTHKEKRQEVETTVKNDEVILLEEIRDLLAKQSKKTKKQQ